jgi:biotin transport system ATP-binding protein
VPNRVGFVFQNPDHQLLFPTVMEELCFGLIDQGVSKHEAEQKAGALLAQYNLLQLKDKATHELSDGQKQLLCILSVLLDGAELLLLDEPCSSLDRKTTEFIMQVIAGLPIPVMMATHDLRLLKDFDRIIWLESGAVLHDGNAQTLIAAYEAQ